MINFPENALIYYDMLFELANFDVIPTEDIADATKEWLGFEEPDAFAEIEEEEIGRRL